MLILNQFIRFGLVGTVGFLVDSGVLTILIKFTERGPFLSRIISYMFSATVTWYLNRNITFKSYKQGSLRGEWIKYIFANLFGALLNYGVYAVMIIRVPLVNAYPIIGVAAGSIAGMMVNFTMSRVYVFHVRDF